MKTKSTFKTLSVLIIFFMSYLSVSAQVTIGYDGPPEEGAILQLKNKTSTTPGGVNADKGFLLPRVELEAPDILTVTTNPTNEDKLNHRGTLVYNMTVDESKNLKEGIYKWDGAKWDYLECKDCGEGNAVFTIENCSTDITVVGNYGTGVTLTGENMVSVKVSVTKTGSYTLNAAITDSNNDNGYFFTSSGVFMALGTYVINLSSMGTPINPGADNFTLLINGVANNGEGVPACTFDVNVNDMTIRPNYSMDCSSTKVMGKYYEELVLTTDNYIEVTIDIESGSVGAAYHLWTNEVDGIKFEGRGTLGATSPQTVKLYGSGTPLGNSDKGLYIQTNSESSTKTCIATVIVIIPPKKLLSIGRHTDPGYCLGAAGTASNRVITDSLNFGPTSNSIVRYAGFKNAGALIGSNIIDFNLANQKAGRTIYAREATYFNSPSTGEERLRLYLEGTTENGEQVTPVDILYIGWTDTYATAGDWTPTTAQMTLIKTFLEKGGIVMVNNENINFNRAFLRGIFDNDSITMTVGANNPAGSVYQLENLPSDPILNGPFGNIAGLYWGEDASTTVYASKLPMEDVLLYSSNKNLCSSASVAQQGAATLFRHRTLPFIWSGDGGFTSGINTAETILTYYPFKKGSKTINGVTYENYPIAKPTYGSASPYYPVYNSVFMANALTWCIKTSDEIRRENRK